MRFKLIDKIVRLAKLPSNGAKLLRRLDQGLEDAARERTRLFEESARHSALIAKAAAEGFSAGQLEALNPRLRRNILPNDDAVMHKQLMATWRSVSPPVIGYRELLESSFRVFSQNDEDGVLLRIFSHIGLTNQYVVEIGSNCSGSDIGIPENLSTNLIVNHGWHGAIFEVDQNECDRTRHFFARDFATKHFHFTNGAQDSYFSPLIIQQAVSPENVNQLIQGVHDEPEPDLMVVDIDGGDYEVVSRIDTVRPRVMVVEFEKRFGAQHCVVQFDRLNFSKRWPQSGAASLPAWEKLLSSQGYMLCAIGNCGFNAFFVRTDVAEGKFMPLSASDAFSGHPILSKVPPSFWLTPDETWSAV